MGLKRLVSRGHRAAFFLKALVRILSLSFPAPRSCLHFLPQGPIIAPLQSLLLLPHTVTASLTLTLLPPLRLWLGPDGHFRIISPSQGP